MATEDVFERSIEALLDGRSLPPSDERTSRPGEALRWVDAIARAHRVALFGRDVPLDRPLGGRWGHLEIRAEIGRGASGTVYRAWDTRLAREVALKLLSTEAAAGDAALEEGRLLARLNHQHIVKVYGADSPDGVPGIWMELLEGDSLDELLAREGPFGPDETLLIGLDLSRALSAVHTAGLLHRDVKARNVLRERGGRIVLMDLGASRTVESGSDATDETGTPMYMAPEVLGGGSASRASDLYSLGVLLFRLLTATYPVLGVDLYTLRSAHQQNKRQTLRSLRPDVDPDIVHAIDRACHPNPHRRHASAADLEVALHDAFRRSIAVRGFVPTPVAREWRRWRRTATGGLALFAAVCSIVLIGWNSTTGRSTRRALGLPVWPRSSLYLSLTGGLGIIRGGELSLVPSHTPRPIAVSSDRGVQTIPGAPPLTDGWRFQLDGTPIATIPPPTEALCCWTDGTTDGDFNYSARQDSTLLEPIGSRPLAPPAVYQFERDWSKPRVHFLLDPEGVYYGVTYSVRSGTFWLTRGVPGGTVIEEWTRSGERIASPITLPAAYVPGLALDPSDGTLWAVTLPAVFGYASGVMRLENFETSGRPLGSVSVTWPSPLIGAAGAEFEWVTAK